MLYWLILFISLKWCVIYTNYLKTPWTLFSADNKLKTILMQIFWGQGALREWKSGITLIYYSFKIFPQFWLAKSTRVIHHNQLPMNKFGIILCLTRKWRQKCSPLQVKASLLRRPGDEIKLFWLWKKWRTFHSFQEWELPVELREIIAKNMAKTAKRQLGGRHLPFGEYLRSWTNLNVHYRRWT